MTAPRDETEPLTVEEALAELAMLEQHHDACCTAIGDERDIDESFARLAATLRQLSAPRPVPAPIGTLIDALELAAGRWGKRPTDELFHEACAARSALEEAYREPSETFQERVRPWTLACFGDEIAADRVERNHRFIEESLELVQACGCTADEAHQLVEYVYGRDQGDVNQEVGGVMVTLAALCNANGLDMHADGDSELARVWSKIELIRAKQAAKPKHSPLPAPSARPETVSDHGTNDPHLEGEVPLSERAARPETEGET